MKKRSDKRLTNTKKPEGDKQGKKHSISISPEAYNSPVCYANKKEEMRDEFRDE